MDLIMALSALQPGYHGKTILGVSLWSEGVRGEARRSLSDQLQLRCQNERWIFLFGDASLCASWQGRKMPPLPGFGTSRSEGGRPRG